MTLQREMGMIPVHSGLLFTLLQFVHSPFSFSQPHSIICTCTVYTGADISTHTGFACAFMPLYRTE